MPEVQLLHLRNFRSSFPNPSQVDALFNNFRLAETSQRSFSRTSMNQLSMIHELIGYCLLVVRWVR